MIENIWHGVVNFFSSVGLDWILSWKEFSPLAMGVLLQLVLIGIIILVFKFARNRKFGILFELFFEKMYEFFEEILGEKSQLWVKRYIVSLFFIILFVNLSGWLLDVFRSMTIVLTAEQWELLSHYIISPSSMIDFNIAMAVVSVFVMLIVQFKSLGFMRFFHEYIPVAGKGIIDIDRGKLKPIFYWPIKFFVKFFDIAISLFVGALDIIGIGAKIISLSARLFGNMLSGGILLGLLVIGANVLTKKIIGVEFAFFIPLVLFVQGLLVAIIQAFVFSLLCAIFVKIGQE